MRLAAVGLALIAFAPLLPAAAPNVPRHRQIGDLSIEAHRILQKYCVECHSPQSGSDFHPLDHSATVPGSGPRPFVRANSPAESTVIEWIEDGSMPPGGRARPTADEVKALRAWVLGGAPTYPASYDESSTLDLIANDIATQANPDDFRYLSFRHLLATATGPVELASRERNLFRAVAQACGEADVPLVPIDPTATVFRLNVGKMRWNVPDLFDRWIDDREEGAAAFRPFDLVLIEYPFATELPGNDPRPAAIVSKFKQILPVPYLRADWLTARLLDQPLGRELKSLRALSEAVGDKPEAPRPEPFAGAEPVKFAPRSDPRPIPPINGLYLGDVLADPPAFNVTFKLAGHKDRENVVEVGEPFKFEVKADRNLSFDLLFVLPNGDVVPTPVAGGNRLVANENRFLGTRRNTPFIITGTLSEANESVEYAVLVVSEVELPLPLLVKSRHPSTGTNTPIQRFLYPFPLKVRDKEDVVLPGRVARYVLPIKVFKKPESKKPDAKKP